MMDDLLSGLAALPDKIMRPRHTPAEPGQQAAFLSVFTSLAPVQDAPPVRDGAAPNGKVIAMVPLLTQALDLVQPDQPPQGLPLPDAVAGQMPQQHAIPLSMPTTPLATPVAVASPPTVAPVAGAGPGTPPAVMPIAVGGPGDPPAAMPIAGMTLAPKGPDDVFGRPHDDIAPKGDAVPLPLALAGFGGPVMAAGPNAAPPASGDGATRPKDAAPLGAMARDLPLPVAGMVAPKDLAPLARVVSTTPPQGTLPVAEPEGVHRDGQAKPALVQRMATAAMPAPVPGPAQAQGQAIAAPPKDALAHPDRAPRAVVSPDDSPRVAPATLASGPPLRALAMPSQAALPAPVPAATLGPWPAPMAADPPALPQGKPITAVPAPMLEAPIAPDIADLPRPVLQLPMAKGPVSPAQGPVGVAVTGLPRMVWSDTAMPALPVPQPGPITQPAMEIAAGTGAVTRPWPPEGALPVTPAPVPPAVAAPIPLSLPVPVMQAVPPLPVMAMAAPLVAADPARGPASLPSATALSDLGDPGALPLGLASVTAHAAPGRLGLPPPDLAPLAQTASQQIASGAAQVQADPGGPVDIALDPPELGRVRLSLVEVNGTMTLSITAERPETADLMRRNLALLAEEFSRLGLDAPSVDISGGGQGGRHHHGDDHVPAGGRHDPQPLGQIAASPAAARPMAANGLDLRL
jgi:flagellar hook-length control protein FliK